jgi:hypothetical protein
MICEKAACSGGTNRLSTLGAASENGEVLEFMQICDGDGFWRGQDRAFGTSYTIHQLLIAPHRAAKTSLRFEWNIATQT